jgi:hypothetical protein
MFIRNQQQLKNAKIIYFTLSLLINASFQIQAMDIEGLDNTKKIIGIQKPALGLTGYQTKIGIIDNYFDPRSDTRDSLSKSTKRAFSGQDPQLVAFRAHASELGEDHANHVSSIIHRIASKARLRVIDMYNEPVVKDELGNNARLIAAIDAAIESKVDFINISQRVSPDDDWNGKISKDLKKAFYKARDAGIGIIKSSGNDNELIGFTPYTRSLAQLLNKMKGNMVLVSATAYTVEGYEELASFSNKAGIAYKYTVSAPGNDIVAYGASYRLIKMSGTSMAAPVVTATSSLLKEAYPNLSSRNILKSIRHSARKISLDQSVYFTDHMYGRGVIDFRSALIEAEKISKLSSSKDN